jgi:hypothetical protein
MTWHEVRAAIRKAAHPPLPKEPFYLNDDGVYDPPDNKLLRRIASFLDGLLTSVSHFPSRRLHRVFSELHSACYRIRLAWLREDNAPLDTGPAFQTAALQPAYSHRDSLARIANTQRLTAANPWMSFEDARLFLMGWNKGFEWRGHTDNSERNDGTSVPFDGPPEQVREAYAAFRSSEMAQTWSVKPASIAGVTLRLECTRQKL